MCYRHQVHATTWALAERAGLKESDYTLAFQSRLGRDPWLKPYTDKKLEAFPSQGVKRLVVLCPAFVSDCLETLEEIAMRGREDFENAGGVEMTYIPCLNDHPRWIDVLVKFAHAARTDAQLPRRSRGPVTPRPPSRSGDARPRRSRTPLWRLEPKAAARGIPLPGPLNCRVNSPLAAGWPDSALQVSLPGHRAPTRTLQKASKLQRGADTDPQAHRRY